MTNHTPIHIHRLGLQPYAEIWEKMKQFTQDRDQSTTDELWLLQHPPVYTFGLNAKQEHMLNPHGIPTLKTDRGGEVTYHGPGQLIAYLLLDVKRRNLGIKDLVSTLQQSVIELLKQYGIESGLQSGAPGVYVKKKKIAALGLRFKKKGCYHGLSLNVEMDLAPFSGINPCGYPGLEVTQIADLSGHAEMDQVSTVLESILIKQLNSIRHYE